MANLEEELVAGGVDMGRTWTSRTLWMPQARQLQSTETTIHNANKKNTETIIATPIKKEKESEP